MSKVIIAITGLYQSGKDTVANFLVKKGFFHISLADILREECRKRKRYRNRDDLIKRANELRREYGAGILAKLAIQRTRDKKAIVVSSIRSPGEIKELKKEGKFFLVAVDASIKLRFARAQKREKIDDKVSFRKFKAQEEFERKGGKYEQQLDKVISSADYRIVNDSTLKNLYQRVNNFLKEILIREKKIILIGRPASGKGTQAELLAEEFFLPLISSGNLFRRYRRKKTELGRKIKNIIDKGNFVPDEVTNRVIFREIKKQKRGFILDGYPRTLGQARRLERAVDLDIVFEIFISEKEVLKRLLGRRVCQCGATYHLIYNPPKKKNICDLCGGALYQREDDTKEIIKKRLENYRKLTKPLIKFYQKKKKLIKINGEQSIKDVFNDIESYL